MIGDVEVEERISAWLHERQQLKTWADPELPHDWNFNAPIGHVQRGPGFDGQLTLDAAVIDVNWHAAVADHARDAARKTWRLMMVDLPLFVWPDGLFCKSVATQMAPTWLPDPQFKRGASYRVVLHGFIA